MRNKIFNWVMVVIFIIMIMGRSSSYIPTRFCGVKYKSHHQKLMQTFSFFLLLFVKQVSYILTWWEHTLGIVRLSFALSFTPSFTLVGGLFIVLCDFCVNVIYYPRLPDIKNCLPQSNLMMQNLKHNLNTFSC